MNGSGGVRPYLREQTLLRAARKVILDPPLESQIHPESN